MKIMKNLEQHSGNKKKILTQEALKMQESQTVEQKKEMPATKRKRIYRRDRNGHRGKLDTDLHEINTD